MLLAKTEVGQIKYLAFFLFKSKTLEWSSGVHILLKMTSKTYVAVVSWFNQYLKKKINHISKEHLGQ